MNKILLLITLVSIGVFGVLVISNQGQVKEQQKDTPTLGNLTPIQQPTTQQSQQDQAQQETEVQGPIKEDTRATISATIKTSKGDITVSLYNDVAPKAVKNFITKAQNNFYNNLTFHRVEEWVIQGGDPKGNGTGGNAFVTELTGKPFVIGSLGWAASQSMQIGQGQRVSNDAQFFITKSDASWLNSEYSNFGIVTVGIDVVKKMQIGDKILGVTVSEE